MAYLRAMFAFEWANFKERLRRLVAQDVDIADWGEVTELDFGPGGCRGEGHGGGRWERR